MSLINQVLHDLDQRRAEGEGTARLPRDVRALPVAEKSRLPWVLGGVAAVVALAAAAWGVWVTWGPARPLPVVESVPAQVVMNTSLPPLAVVDLSPVPSAPAPVALLPAAPVTGASAMPVLRTVPVSERLPSLKLSGELQSVGALPVAADAGARGGAVPEPEGGQIDKSPAESTPQERAERLYRAATMMFGQGRQDDGLTTLRAALREDPTHVPARQLLIKFYFDTKAWDAAQGVLRDGLIVLPKQPGWPMLLARLLLDRSDPASAVSVLERHEAYAVGSADYQSALGAALQRSNRLDEAEVRFVRATEIDPRNGRWWLGLAAAREALGKTAEARDAFSRAVQARNLPPDLHAYAESKLK